jgi:hypothetical protein
MVSLLRDGKHVKTRKEEQIMSRYEHAITTLQARTILSMIDNHYVNFTSAENIKMGACHIVSQLMKDFPDQFPSSPETKEYFSYLAFTLSACAKYGVKTGQLKVIDFLAMIADAKEKNETSLHDFGAFGDLFEILVRCAFMKKLSLVTWSALSVKDILTCDMVSKKYGRIEIGHNGKTLTFGTLFDYMSGEYDSIVYGVFSDEDKKMVYDFLKNRQYEKAIETVCSYSVYWRSKYDFQKDMDGLTRGKGITVKSGQVQVVYNPGKYNAFVQAIENGIFTSLDEMLQG